VRRRLRISDLVAMRIRYIARELYAPIAVRDLNRLMDEVEKLWAERGASPEAETPTASVETPPERPNG
jgi:hypothetical protein